ncbi:hypothetical protein LCGC14_2846060, partial [marine sediment metagenome]
MIPENEFKVNEYIILKLEDNATNIYVDGELFQQCKTLLLSISAEDFSYFDEIDSIDEVAEKLDKSLEDNVTNEFEISAEVEFWGHCSNLQVWVESNYDTRLIHSNLAFPLLRKLTGIGDIMAKRVFTEEIAKRFQNGSPQVITYLVKENYLDLLNKEDRTELLKEKYVSLLNEFGEFDLKANYKVFYELIKFPEFIKINFTNFLNQINKLNNIKKDQVFLRFIKTFRETKLIRDKFKDILNWIVDLKPEEHYYNFLSLINNIRETELSENISAVLNVMDKIDNVYGITYIFSNFIKEIEIEVLKENFVEILNGFDRLNLNENYEAFFAIINKLEGTEFLKEKFPLIKEKFPLIKEKFPKLSNFVLTDSRILEALCHDKWQSIE